MSESNEASISNNKINGEEEARMRAEPSKDATKVSSNARANVVVTPEKQGRANTHEISDKVYEVEDMFSSLDDDAIAQSSHRKLFRYYSLKAAQAKKENDQELYDKFEKLKFDELSSFRLSFPHLYLKMYLGKSSYGAQHGRAILDKIEKSGWAYKRNGVCC